MIEQANNWEIANAIGTCVGALGTIAGLFFVASQLEIAGETAQSGYKPVLHPEQKYKGRSFDDRGNLIHRITNVGEGPALNIRVRRAAAHISYIPKNPRWIEADQDHQDLFIPSPLNKGEWFDVVMEVPAPGTGIVELIEYRDRAQRLHQTQVFVQRKTWGDVLYTVQFADQRPLFSLARILADLDE